MSLLRAPVQVASFLSKESEVTISLNGAVEINLFGDITKVYSQ